MDLSQFQHFCTVAGYLQGLQQSLVDGTKSLKDQAKNPYPSVLFLLLRHLCLQPADTGKVVQSFTSSAKHDLGCAYNDQDLLRKSFICCKLFISILYLHPLCRISASKVKGNWMIRRWEQDKKRRKNLIERIKKKDSYNRQVAVRSEDQLQATSLAFLKFHRESDAWVGIRGGFLYW